MWQRYTAGTYINKTVLQIAGRLNENFNKLFFGLGGWSLFPLVGCPTPWAGVGNFTPSFLATRGNRSSPCGATNKASCLNTHEYPFSLATSFTSWNAFAKYGCNTSCCFLCNSFGNIDPNSGEWIHTGWLPARLACEQRSCCRRFGD